MKRKRSLYAVTAALAAIVAAFAVQTATADPGGTNHAYVCFSTVADPGLFAADDSSVFATWNSYATGYSSPFAETATPTTEPMHGYYLTCSMPAGWVITGYILGDGSKVVQGPDPTPYLQMGLPVPGVYPVIGPPPAA